MEKKEANKKQTNNNKYYVYKYLAPGRENARTAKQLAQMLHATSRTITQQIEKERRHAADIGEIICAEVWGATKGYYLAETQEEAESYFAVLLHRENEISKTRAAMTEAYNKTPPIKWRNSNA